MADGYEIRDKSIRVYFYWEGKRRRETIGDATRENKKRAQRLSEIIRYEIETGTFDYARHFPESSYVKNSSFGFYLDIHLSIKENSLAESSYRSEKQKANAHLRPRWGHFQMETIDHIDIQKWVQSDLSKKLGNKTIKEIISIMRQVFNLYGTRSKTSYNPTLGIKISLPDKPDPDPFTLEEMERIFTTPTNRIQELNLLEYMMWDGPRVSEAIALAWEDVISIEKGIIRYQRAKVLGNYKVTKTRRSTRTHKLTKRSREVLQRQWRLTGQLSTITIEVTDRDNRTKRKQKIRPVFLNTESLKPHDGDQNIRERFWEAHLKAAGVRYRPPSQARHTFISQMLSTGVVPLHWIANHVGHTTIEMIQRTYGKWMPTDGANIQEVIEKYFEM
jgi:integrase